MEAAQLHHRDHGHHHADHGVAGRDRGAVGGVERDAGVVSRDLPFAAFADGAIYIFVNQMFFQKPHSQCQTG